MQRILMASADSAEHEWFTEEMKDARIVGNIQSLEFFIQQWQSVQADTCIVSDNVVAHEELLLSHVNWFQEQESSVKVVFIHLREHGDEFITTLKQHNVICVHYEHLDPGVVEETLRASMNGETEFHYKAEDEVPLQEESAPDQDAEEAASSEETAPSAESDDIDEVDEETDQVYDQAEAESSDRKGLLGGVIPFLVNRAKKAEEQQAAAEEKPQVQEGSEDEDLQEHEVVVQEPEPAPTPPPILPKREEKRQKKATSHSKPKERSGKFMLASTNGTYTIGVAGVRGRVGTTTISLQAATFLVKQGLKVAVCELSKNEPVFWKLSFDRKIPFVVEGMYLYPKCENFIDIMYSNQYDVVILDVGSLLENKTLSPVAYEFVRLHKKILTTSPGVWDMDKLMDTIQLLQERNFLSKTDIIINPSSGSVPAIEKVLTKKHCAELGVRLFHTGIIPDPFEVHVESVIKEILRGDHT